MAYVSNQPLSSGLRAQADAFFARLGQGFNAFIELRSRSAELNVLQAKSDAELAALGISRDRIVEHVFRDKLGY